MLSNWFLLYCLSIAATSWQIIRNNRHVALYPIALVTGYACAAAVSFFLFPQHTGDFFQVNVTWLLDVFFVIPVLGFCTLMLGSWANKTQIMKKKHSNTIMLLLIFLIGIFIFCYSIHAPDPNAYGPAM
jgi:hypothetical protein